MAVPSLRDSTSGTTSTASHPFTVSCNIPSGRQSGDLLVLLIAEDTARTVVGAPGWDAEWSGAGMQAYAKISDGTETTASVSYNGTAQVEYWCGAYSGVAASIGDAYVRVSAYVASGTNTADCPTATATAADALVLRAYRANGATGCDTPSGYTSRRGVSGDPSLYVFEKDAGVAAGAVGTLTLTGLTSFREKYLATAIVQPSGAVAPTISSVTLTGTSQIGNTLTATVVTDQDPVDSTAYQWEKASDGSGTGAADISGETSSTLALTYADFGDLLDTAAYVRCGAIATKNSLPSDEAFSAWQQVTVAAGGGFSGSPLKSPFLIA